eukprot:scaffold1809_cov228-Pinguiococcus_pyrenoidosus.AAC.8
MEPAVKHAALAALICHPFHNDLRPSPRPRCSSRKRTSSAVPRLKDSIARDCCRTRIKSKGFASREPTAPEPNATAKRVPKPAFSRPPMRCRTIP